MTWKPIPRALLEAQPELWCPVCRSDEINPCDSEFASPDDSWCGNCGAELRFARPTPEICPVCGLDRAVAGWPLAHLVPGSRDEVCEFQIDTELVEVVW